jgi:hypothetical protein
MYIFDNRTFHIGQNSTRATLKYILTQLDREDYDLTDEKLENVAVTFSMVDRETGVYKIANVEGRLIINRDRPSFPDECEYTLAYDFKLRDTRKSGVFDGEFKLDFLGDNCGKLTLPVHKPIQIIIKPSITKTTVI